MSMDLEKTWPYLLGAGVLLLLLVLGRSNGPAGASTLVALPTSNPADDALSMQKEVDRTGLLAGVLQSATALQGNVDNYKGEATLAQINATAQEAITQVNATRDISINRTNASTALAINGQNTQSANVISSMNNKTARQNGAVQTIGNVVGAVVKAFNPLTWF